MATWFHASLKPVSRSAGRSVVAAAAYRTGSSINDERYGTVRDFSRKNDVVSSFTVAPEGAPDWARDTAQLWNAVEKKENRGNSILAYELEVALPYELDDAQREAIARNIADWSVKQFGVAVTVGIHDGGERGTGEYVGKNYHAHILLTTRALDEHGWEKNKLRDFNVRPGTPNPVVDNVRWQVSQFINEGLAEAGSGERVTPESFASRGITAEPQIHLGPAATAKQRAAVDCDRADVNSAIIESRLREQERYAEQLDKQFGDAPKDIDKDTALELSQRFGDVLPERTSGVSDDCPERTTGEPLASGERHWGWRVLADRARTFLSQFYHDQTSGPRTEPIAETDTAPGAEAVQPEPEQSRSWISRVVDTGRHFASAFGHIAAGKAHGNFSEMAEGAKEVLTEAGRVYHAAVDPKKTDEAAQPPPEQRREPARASAPVDAESPPNLEPQQANTRPMTAFERAFSNAPAKKPEPTGRPTSAFERAFSPQATPKTATPAAPEPDLSPDL